MSDFDIDSILDSQKNTPLFHLSIIIQSVLSASWLLIEIVLLMYKSLLFG